MLQLHILLIDLCYVVFFCRSTVVSMHINSISLILLFFPSNCDHNLCWCSDQLWYFVIQFSKRVLSLLMHQEASTSSETSFLSDLTSVSSGVASTIYTSSSPSTYLLLRKKSFVG
ncbi:unnamed protein product [Cuscuta europaea]|uniref:Uncharacterized protein n=1 Tax=Cuscuta europaea TaxID=41803 RepID=A0A9P0Z741_CUSEU|nr:unnamed protein product [Cuscuta europaea]